jgi:hypothetical protein
MDSNYMWGRIDKQQRKRRINAYLGIRGKKKNLTEPVAGNKLIHPLPTYAKERNINNNNKKEQSKRRGKKTYDSMCMLVLTYPSSFTLPPYSVAFRQCSRNLQTAFRALHARPWSTL